MMPVYNGERYIREAIESVISQTYTQWELIVVNDGSTDRTAEIARSLSDPRISVWDQSNGGEGAARNTALGKMKGEFVAFLDADDVYLPDHLLWSVHHLQAHLDHDGVYSDGFYIDETGRWLIPLSGRRLPSAEGKIFEQIVRASCMIGPPVCVVLRRSQIVAHALTFDTTLHCGTDWNFFTRFAEASWFGYLARVTCLYRIHSGSITNVLGAARRAEYLSLCRIKATRLKEFCQCSAETRSAVFYDLLVNLCLGKPGEQTAIIEGPEFRELPVSEQARLLRLMASKTVICRPAVTEVLEWLRRAKALDASDNRAALLLTLYTISPRLCRFLLKLRTHGQSNRTSPDPFDDIRSRPRGMAIDRRLGIR